MYDISEHGSWRDHLKKRNAEKRGEDTSQRILRFKGPLSGETRGRVRESVDRKGPRKMTIRAK